MKMSSIGPNFQQAPRRYRFVLIVSGSGEVHSLGTGTLQQGKEICDMLEQCFEMSTSYPKCCFPSPFKELLSVYEGCDICAHSIECPNEEVLVYTDKWETL